MKKKIILLFILILLAGCKAREELKLEESFVEPKTFEKPISSVPKAIDLSGHWEGSFSFTNNCENPSCKYNGKEGSVKMDITHDLDKVSGEVVVDYTMFEAESFIGGDADEVCPTIKEFGLLKGTFNENYGNQRFGFMDQFSNVWDVSLKSNLLEATIDNDGPGCTGMKSRDVILSKK